MIELWLVFVTGVLSSLHCFGMCGPIVLAYSMSGGSPEDGPARAGVFKLHAAYNGGRIISYSLMGAVAGLIGMAFSSMKVVGEWVSTVGGGLMILAGILLLGIVPVPQGIAEYFKSSRSAKLFGALLRSPSVFSKLALGLLTPLLPCGILYAMALRAAASQDVLNGALIMALFALGMAPALALVGSLSSLFSGRIRKGAEQLAAIAVIVLGVTLMLRGLGVPYLSWFTGGGSSGC